MSTDPPANLWQPRSVDDTLRLYASWAKTYDADVTAWGYATPGRIATALADQLIDKSVAILDFGCGTGLSGAALRAQGFTCVDGTDASNQMIKEAQATNLYRKTWTCTPDHLDVRSGTYAAITAIGVIGAGAAPAATLDLIFASLARAGLLAMSYNDATLLDPDYTDRLQSLQDSRRARLLFNETGPHLPGKDMNSTVYILEKT